MGAWGGELDANLAAVADEEAGYSGDIEEVGVGCDLAELVEDRGAGERVRNCVEPDLNGEPAGAVDIAQRGDVELRL